MMKKITFTFLVAMVVSFTSMAQTTGIIYPDQKPQYLLDAIIDNSPQSERFQRRDSRDQWYFFSNEFSTFNGLQFRGIVNFLFPDTPSIIYPSGEKGAIFNHNFGASFDPKDPVFGNDRFSRWTSYTVDSFSWVQCYIRQVDSMDQITRERASGTITVVDYTQLQGATLEVNGVSMVEGVNFDALNSNASTAQSIENAIVNFVNSQGNVVTLSLNDNELTLRSIVLGPQGNQITLSSDNPTNLAVSGPTLEGGSINTTRVEIIDTLIIEYFSESALEPRNLSFANDPGQTYLAAMPRVNTYQPATITNSAAFKRDTIYLNAEYKDSMTPEFSFLSRRLVVPVNARVNGSNTVTGNLTAACLLFKPMKPYTNKDTLIALLNSVQVQNKHNVFAIQYFTQEGFLHRILDEQALNNSFSTNNTLKTGGAGGGGWRAYAPSLNAFNSFLFHVTTDNLSVNSFQDNKGNRLGEAYPNPTSGASHFVIPFEISNGGKVEFTLTDITGKTIQKIQNDFQSGQNSVRFDASNLKSGVYFYQMNTGNFKGVGKVIVT
jgi:hypothetical protein